MLKLCEKTFMVLMLLYTTGAIVPFLGSHGGTTQASKFELAVQIPLYAVAFAFIVLHWRTFLDAALRTKWLLILTTLAVASTAWSQVPTFTLRRSMILVATTAFGVYFGARFDVNQQLRFLAKALGIVVVLSFVFAMFLPKYGIDQALHNGNWQGVFTHKNSLGRAAVLSIAVFMFARLRFGRWLSWIGVCGALALLLLSKSATSALVLGFLVVLQVVLKMFRTRLTFAVPLFTFGGLVLSLALLSGTFAFPNLLQLVHRDAGMTGRTMLWTAVIGAITRRPWTGYGFDGFWLGMQGASGMLVQQLHWAPPHSHNGFLDLMLEVGVPGLVLFLVGYLLLWGRALKFLKRDRSDVPVWLCTYLFFMLVYNFSERTILDQNSIYWVLYASTSVSLYLDLPHKVRIENPVFEQRFQPGMPAPEVA